MSRWDRDRREEDSLFWDRFDHDMDVTFGRVDEVGRRFKEDDLDRRERDLHCRTDRRPRRP